jgi:hypothetical protein
MDWLKHDECDRDLSAGKLFLRLASQVASYIKFEQQW